MRGYPREELIEFERILEKKIAVCERNLNDLQARLAKINDGKIKVTSLDDSSEVEQREQLNHQILREQKFLTKLKESMHRIKKGTYGICSNTGMLIAKDRLRIVPHTTKSITAKHAR